MGECCARTVVWVQLEHKLLCGSNPQRTLSSNGRAKPNGHDSHLTPISRERSFELRFYNYVNWKYSNNHREVCLCVLLLMTLRDFSPEFSKFHYSIQINRFSLILHHFSWNPTSGRRVFEKIKNRKRQIFLFVYEWSIFICTFSSFSLRAIRPTLTCKSSRKCTVYCTFWRAPKG